MRTKLSGRPARVTSPSLEELDRLRTPLNAAEELVLEFFLNHLPPAWEVYIQPHLNGLRPDFVLLHPRVGVAVYEVKGWNFDRREFEVDWSQNGAPVLLSRNRNEANFYRVDDNPVDKIYYYKQEMSEIYCARAGGANAYRIITAGVICPLARQERLDELFAPFRAQYRMEEFPDYYPLAGREALDTNDIRAVFPEVKRTSSQYMNEAVAQDLRGWLVEPDHARTQREPLNLTEKQRKAVEKGTVSGYRRIKGPVGSGKSLVLAARAAELAREGKQVMVVSYNITLLHYLRDLAVRWPKPGATPLDRITFVNFHAWCKRVCLETGHLKEYQALMQGRDEELADDWKVMLEDELPGMVMRVLDGPDGHKAIRYDAVLVDEGQDFREKWWHVLRKITVPGGEMVLAADPTQDIYDRIKHWSTGAWTDRPMEGAGFRGPWYQLDVTYRLPRQLTLLVNDYARHYLPPETALLPVEEPLPLIPDFSEYPCHLKWIETNEEAALGICYEEIMGMIKTATPHNVGISDITFLVPTVAFGHELIQRLAENHFNILHTFSSDEFERRKQKHAFFMGDARVKGTTIHSFKGWECRALIIYAGASDGPRAKALLYTAMTRLKRHTGGSFLTVVSAIPSLMEYGRKWDSY